MREDRVDCHCNRIHVACIGLQRLKRQEPYQQDPVFKELVENFCRSADILMGLIRKREAVHIQYGFHNNLVVAHER